jgi:hypothetical protein
MWLARSPCFNEAEAHMPRMLGVQIPDVVVSDPLQ